MARKLRERGRCDACGKEPRVLNRIESGQRICRSCLHRLRQTEPPGGQHPATSEQSAEASSLGLNIPADATERDAATLLSFARRQFEVTPELLAEDHDRLVHLQDDVMCYVADTWEQLTGQPLDEARIAWWDRHQLAAGVVMEQRDLAIAIQRIQRQRERKRRALEAECGPDVAWDACRQPVAEDDTYQRIARLLKQRWQKFLPRKGGLLGRLLGGGQRAGSGSASRPPGVSEERE